MVLPDLTSPASRQASTCPTDLPKLSKCFSAVPCVWVLAAELGLGEGGTPDPEPSPQVWGSLDSASLLKDFVTCHLLMQITSFSIKMNQIRTQL